MGGGGCRIASPRAAVRSAALALLAFASACATAPRQQEAYPGSYTGSIGPHALNAPLPSLSEEPDVIIPKKRLQCVPYARDASGIEIYGNAATWWKSAAGKYRRGHTPAPGTVMVFKSSSDNRYGHVAVVRSIKSSRLIVIDHANWFGQGEITTAIPVIDVSPRNDWSQVRVWWLPDNQWGMRVFSIAGFIHPDREVASR